MEASIIIPIHNESQSLIENSVKLDSYLKENVTKYEIIFVENGSHDKTSDIVKMLADGSECIKALFLDEPNLPKALKLGFGSSKYSKIVYYPIDLSVNFSFIVESLTLLDDWDIVIGSKRCRNAIDYRPLARRIASKTYHWLVRQLFQTNLTDTTCVKSFRRGVILSLMNNIPLYSEVYETELLIKAQISGCKITEIPVKVIENRPSRQPLIKKIYGKFIDLISLRLDLITLALGSLILSLGLFGIILLIIEKVELNSFGFANPYSFLLAMLFVISGFQLLIFGLLTHLILKIRGQVNSSTIDFDMKQFSLPEES
jgi:glycosyltransferase involved in cell wall biosynthesis